MRHSELSEDTLLWIHYSPWSKPFISPSLSGRIFSLTGSRLNVGSSVLISLFTKWPGESDHDAELQPWHETQSPHAVSMKDRGQLSHMRLLVCLGGTFPPPPPVLQKGIAWPTCSDFVGSLVR